MRREKITGGGATLIIINMPTCISQKISYSFQLTCVLSPVEENIVKFIKFQTKNVIR